MHRPIRNQPAIGAHPLSARRLHSLHALMCDVRVSLSQTTAAMHRTSYGIPRCATMHSLCGRPTMVLAEPDIGAWGVRPVSVTLTCATLMLRTAVLVGKCICSTDNC